VRHMGTAVRSHLGLPGNSTGSTPFTVLASPAERPACAIAAKTGLGLVISFTSKFRLFAVTDEILRSQRSANFGVLPPFAEVIE
jgi:hypothetical protein